MVLSRLYSPFYLLAIFSIVAYLYVSNLTGGAYDVAAHYSLIDKIDKDFFINQGYTANLDEMAKYPPGAHYLSSFINYFTGSALISMNLVNLLSLFCIWCFISLMLIETGPTSIILVLVSISCVYFLGLNLPVFGLEVVGGNFLFGQFVSTAYFFIFIYQLYQTNLSYLQNLVLSLLAFYFGLYLHASFALIYLSGSCLHFLYFYVLTIDSSKIKKLLLLFAYGLCGVLAFVCHPYTKFANEMKLHNGSLYFTYFTNTPTDLSREGVWFIFVVLLTSSLIFLICLLNKNIRSKSPRSLIHINLFLLGAACITAAQLILLEGGIVAPYVVKKNFFVLFTFSVLIMSMLLAAGVKGIHNRFFMQRTRSSMHSVVFIPLIFIVIVKSYYSSSQSDIKEIMKSQAIARDFFAQSIDDVSYRNTIAQFHKLSMASNWMITLSELQVDKKGILSQAVTSEDMSILPGSAFVLSETRGDGVHDNGILMGDYRVYSADAYKTPLSVSSGVAVDTNIKNVYTSQFLTKGFSYPEVWGTWTDEARAEIKFSLSRSPSRTISIILNVNAWIDRGHDNFLVTAIYRGKQIGSHTFSDSRVTDWVLNIDKHEVDPDNVIVVDLVFNNSVSPQSVGVSADPRKLGLGLRRFVVIY